jgi:hypothetical protein
MWDGRVWKATQKEATLKLTQHFIFGEERMMFQRFLRLCCFGFLALSLVSSPAFSQGKGKGHNKEDGDDDHGKGHKKAKHEFDEHDREVITSYYSGRTSNLPPGLAKRGGNLPPGLEKQLERNGTLPPGLQKRMQPCPVELERQLPPVEAGYARGVIGAHLVIYNRSTHVIVDIVKDVVH